MPEDPKDGGSVRAFLEAAQQDLKKIVKEEELFGQWIDGDEGENTTVFGRVMDFFAHRKKD